MNRRHTLPAPPAPHPAPTLRWMLASPARCMALGLGSGLLRPGPGTWGTLLAWSLWLGGEWLLHHFFPHVLRSPSQNAALVLPAVLLVFGLVLGAWACQLTGKALGQADHGNIVWDEMLAFWLLLWLLPSDLTTQTVAFVLFRVFDILKPAPIRQFDARFKNGWGVMCDDLLAAAYAWLFTTLGMIWLMPAMTSFSGLMKNSLSS